MALAPHHREGAVPAAVGKLRPAEAKYENGVLMLTLPKKSGTTTHQLQIH